MEFLLPSTGSGGKKNTRFENKNGKAKKNQRETSFLSFFSTTISLENEK